MFWGLSGLRRNNSWSFSICHGSESGGNVCASEVCSEVNIFGALGCRISTCVDLCHQVRHHHQTQLHYHHQNHHLSIEMTCQWQVCVVYTLCRWLKHAQATRHHVSLNEWALKVSVVVGCLHRTPGALGKKWGVCLCFFALRNDCKAHFTSFHVNVRVTTWGHWIFHESFASMMARSWIGEPGAHHMESIAEWFLVPNEDVMVRASDKRFGAQLHVFTHIESGCRSLVLSFSSRHVTHVLLGTILRIERFIALFCAIKALRGSELFYSVEAKIAQNSGDFTFSELSSMSGQRAHQDVTPWAWSNPGKLEVASCWQVT